MATKQEKIEAIYEKIANKELSFWCRVIIETTWLQHSCSSGYDEEYTWIIYEYAIWLDDYLGWKVKEWNLLGSEDYYLFSWECYNPDNLDFSDFKYFEWVMSVWESEEKKDTTYLYKIIWHPVMLGDVLDYLWDKKWLMTIDRIIRHWKKKRLPIEDQDDGFIDYIYRTLQ